MKTGLLALPFLLLAAFVSYGPGSILNALPVLVSLGVLLFGSWSPRATFLGCIAFAVSATLLVVLFHVAWIFDWGGIATSSSTASLALLFVPIWACVAGSIIGVVAWCLARMIGEHK